MVNRAGRVFARAVPSDAEEPAAGKMTVVSPKGVSEKEVKVTGTSIIVVPTDPQRRIDVILVLPERVRIKAETDAGAVEVSGNAP